MTDDLIRAAALACGVDLLKHDPSEWTYLLVAFARQQRAEAEQAMQGAVTQSAREVRRLEKALTGNQEAATNWRRTAVAKLEAAEAEVCRLRAALDERTATVAEVWDALADFVAREGDMDIPGGSTIGQGVKSLCAELIRLRQTLGARLNEHEKTP